MIEAHTQRPPGTTTPHPPKTKARCEGSATGPQERKLQLMYAHSKATALLARGFLCQNRRKLKGPVRRNTFGIAYATRNDMAGFVAPDFLTDARILGVGMVCCGRGVAYPQGWPHGYTHVSNHHAHTLRVETQRVVPESRIGAKTMHMANTQRPSAHTAHHGHTSAHAGHPCNPDRLTVGNAPMLDIEPVKGGAQ